MTVAVGALTLAMLGGVTATAYAAERGDPGITATTPNGVEQPVTTPSSDITTGPQAALGARRWAVVSSAGVLARGRNAFSADQVSGGTYEVFFDRDVTQCAYIATIGTTSTGTESPGSITVASRAGQPTAVWVDTSNVDGTDGMRGFHLQVIC